MGIAKVNIGAERRKAFMDGIRNSLANLGLAEKFPHIIFPPALKRHAALIEEKMTVLGSVGKA